MLMAFVFSLAVAAISLFLVALAGGVRLIAPFVIPADLVWMAVLQMAVLIGLIGYLVSTVYEKSILFTLIVALIVSVILTFMVQFAQSWVLRALILLAFQVLFVGGIVAGDLLGRPRLWLRAVLGAAGGIMVGVLISGISGLVAGGGKGLILGISNNLVVILELGIAPSLALFLVRVIFPVKKPTKTEEEKS